MRLLHLVHVWIESNWRAFQIATLRTDAPFDIVLELRLRQLALADKARRLG